MKKDLVSVIVPTYKRPWDYLGRAIDSLLKQTYQNIEVIVVDDSPSSYLGRNIIIEHMVDVCQKDSRVRYLLNAKNMGSSLTRNKGIMEAKGKYITFLDDDDMYLPQKIENQYLKMVEEDADYSITDLSLYYEDGKLVEYRKRWYLLTEESQNLLVCHLKYHMSGTDTLMFKRSYLCSIGMFRYSGYGDETFLMFDAIQHGGKFVYCQCNDVYAVVHKEYVGLSFGENKIAGENQVYEYKKQYFSGLSNSDIDYIKMRHFAVLAFAYYRAGLYFKFLQAGIKSFFASPVGCVNLLRRL